jgi:hypothetical protein
MAAHVAQYNSTPTNSQGAPRIGDFGQPLSHSSQMNSQQARPVPAINYKDIVLAEGVEMFQRKQAKKESQSELTQMQNRIRLLQLQEAKIKRRNE